MAKGAESRERILAEAVKLASREGLDRLSIGTLSASAGFSKSGLFAHFKSKTELELQVLKTAADWFRETVVRPALKEPRGERRVRAVFERWLEWGYDPRMPGGCLFTALANELDDREGPPRDYLAQQQAEWLATLARVARTGVETGEFRADLDAEQFAFDLYGIMLSCYFARRLLRDPRADERARTAFEALVNSIKATEPQ